MTGERVDRRLAAVLAADVAGYSRLMGLDEEGTLARLKTVRKVYVDPTILAYRGRIVKTTGDGILVEFGSAVDAVSAAIEVQRSLASPNVQEPESKRIEIRIGIHVGDIIVDDNDIFGESVNIAARLEAVADPGSVCISDDVYRHVRGKIDIICNDLGPLNLKNIAEPVRAWRIQYAEPGFAKVHPIQPTGQTPTLVLPDKPSIAVLPFQNMSGDPDQEYFADGTVEDIITALSRFKSLFVTARDSSFVYKNKPIDIRQVGSDLGVRYVLQGSVRRSGNRIRVTGQLIEAATAKHMWADKFDGALEDVFDLQDCITAAVVGLIAPQIEEAEIERARQKPTDSLDSYDFYLRGLAQLHKREWVDSRALFKKAYELDPEFAAAYAMAAFTFLGQQAAGGQPTTTDMRAEALRLTNAAAYRASEDAFVLARCGHILTYFGDEFDRGTAMVEKALSLNPNLASARFAYGWISVVACEGERAIESFESMIRFSPLDMLKVNSSAGIAWGLWLEGRYDEGLALARSVVTIYPNVQAFGSLIANGVGAGQIQEAKGAMAELVKIDPALRLARAREMYPLRKTEFRSKLDDAFRAAGLPY